MGKYLILRVELFIKNNLTEFLFDLPKIQAIGTLLSCDDNVTTLGKVGFVQSKEFPNEPLYLVSLYRVPDLFACSYPKSSNAQPVMLKNDCKMGRLISFARPI
jgi:hypothetical protein